MPETDRNSSTKVSRRRNSVSFAAGPMNFSEEELSGGERSELEMEYNYNGIDSGSMLGSGSAMIGNMRMNDNKEKGSGDYEGYEEEDEEGMNGSELEEEDYGFEEDDYDEGYSPPTLIMNQKSLADKAPGAIQHDFIHRTIPLIKTPMIRMFYFFLVLMIAVMSAGIPFGLPALRQLLLDEKVYRELCTGEEGNHNGALLEIEIDNDPFNVGCTAQECRLAFLQIAGWVSWMMASWLAVRAVKRWGPRVTGIAGSFALMIGSGSLALSVSRWIPWFQFYFPPIIFMSSGSVFVFISCLHFIRLFPKRTSLLHSMVFLAQDLSAALFDFFYDSAQTLTLKEMFAIYSSIMFGQILLFQFVLPKDPIPTMRFTVSSWHVRPLMADLTLREHVQSPYFWIVLTFMCIYFTRIFFYMSTVQVQLRLLLNPQGDAATTPVDFAYNSNDGHIDQSLISIFSDRSAGAAAANVISLRQFTYNPLQPEIFLTDLQDMLYMLMPLASLVAIFWMRTVNADLKISWTLLLLTIGLVAWGIIQNVITVPTQAFSAILFPIFKPVLLAILFELCERIFGCQHFHFTFWFLLALTGLIVLIILLPLVYLTINRLNVFGLVNQWLNRSVWGTLVLIWVLKCNNL